MKFQTFEGNKPEIAVTSVDFILRSIDGTTSIKVKGAYSVPKLTIQKQTLDVNSARNTWPYLKDISIPQIDPEKVVVLIGMDVPQAHQELDVRRAEPISSGPIATLTPFGWCVSGPITFPGRNWSIPQINSLISEQSLNDQVEKFWDIDAMGTLPHVPDLLSDDDYKAVKILESTIRCVDNRYEVGLMWRESDPVLPDNRSSAFRRLLSIESRFKRDPAFAKTYRSVIEEYIALGHARLISHAELTDSPLGPGTYRTMESLIQTNRTKSV